VGLAGSVPAIIKGNDTARTIHIKYRMGMGLFDGKSSGYPIS
jgi:hypothetical protein